MARQYGATEEEIATLDQLERSPLSPREKQAVQFAEQMTRQAGGVTSHDIDRLREHFSEAEIVEMACVIGLFNYLNRFAEALGLEPTRPGEGGPDQP